MNTQINSTSVRNTPRPQLEKLLSDIGKLKGSVDQLEQGYRDVYRQSDNAQRDLQSMEWPLREAQSDTPQKDVSWQGRDAQRYLESAERSVGDNDRRLMRIDGDSQSAINDFAKAQKDLDAAIASCASYPDSLSKLQQANTSLDKAEKDHKDGDSQGSWAQSDNSWVISDLRFAESPVRNITYDRPGMNVSNDAYQASNQVRQADSRLQRVEMNLDTAVRDEDQSGKGLGNVQELLRQAIAALPAQ